MLIRNRTPLGPCSRIMPRALWWPYGGGLFLMIEVPLYGRDGPTRKPRPEDLNRRRANSAHMRQCGTCNTVTYDTVTYKATRHIRQSGTDFGPGFPCKSWKCFNMFPLGFVLVLASGVGAIEEGDLCLVLHVKVSPFRSEADT